MKEKMWYGDFMRMSVYQSKIILFAIMIGFCILSLLAIVRGQRDLREEQEQPAPVQESDVITQEPEEAAENSPNTDITETDRITTEEESADTELQQTESDSEENASQNTTEANQKSEPMQIVLLGDSILEATEEFDNVDVLIAEACNAKVYNMAMGGTTAALLGGEQYEMESWPSRCLIGVAHAIAGNISGEIFEGFHAGEVLQECNFEETDYFVIEYGLNDFFSRVPESRYLADGGVREEDDAHTYAGALDSAVCILRDAYPDAKIMLVSPHYCQFFDKEGYIGDAYSLDYGYGPLITYANVCKNVYENHREENVFFFDAFQNSGIKVETADWYLSDGIHLNASGRHLYADAISRRLLADFYPEE